MSKVITNTAVNLSLKIVIGNREYYYFIVYFLPKVSAILLPNKNYNAQNLPNLVQVFQSNFGIE